MQKFKYLTQGGQSLLEFAIVVPILLALMVGAYDVNNVIRARTALQEGVKSTLRCLYPTDGQCWQAHADSRSRLFHAVRENPTYEYTIGEFDYNGTASWLNGPVLNFTSAGVNTIGRVSYGIQNPQYEARWNNNTPVPYRGEVPYAVLAYTVPYTQGNELDPNFSLDGSNNGDYPDNSKTTVSVSGVGGITSSRNGVGIGKSGTFTIPNPLWTISDSGITYRDIPCFRSNNTDRGVATEKNANFANLCSTSQTRLMLDISGEILDSYRGTNADLGAEGKALIQLVIGSGSNAETIDLGGRVFNVGDNNSRHGNFAPRGYTMVIEQPRVQIGVYENKPIYKHHFERDADGDLHYDTEGYIHSDLNVPFDTEMYIQFRLQSTDGKKVAWRPTKIRAFWSVYETTAEKANCLQKYPADPSLIIDSCASDHPSKLPAQKAKATIIIPPVNEQHITLPCGTNAENKAQALASSGVPNPNYWTISEVINPLCGITPKRLDCPANFGIDGNFVDGETDVSNNAQAKALCPINDPELSRRNLQPIEPHWVQTTKTKTFAAVKHTPNSCQELDLPEVLYPSEIKNFKKVKINPPTLEHTRKIFTLDIYPDKSPAELKSTMAQYNCSSFNVGSQSYNESTRPRLETGSLFVGKHKDLGCGWEEKLRRAAKTEANEDLRINDKTYFKASESRVGEVKVSELNGDSCTAYKKIVSKVTDTEDLGTMKEQDLPSACLQPGGNCRISFAGYSNDGNAAKSDYDPQIAVNTFGMPEIQSSIPQAMSTKDINCSSAYCTNISVDPINDPNDPGKVLARARMVVPTYFLQLIGHNNVVVSYQETERLERQFSK